MAQSVYGDAFYSKSMRDRWRSRAAINGLPRGTRNVVAYRRQVAASAAWGRRNRAKTNAASRRYRKRMTLTVGSSGHFGQWLFAAINTAKRLKLRKALIHELTKLTTRRQALKVLPRKLVESRKRTNMVPSGKVRLIRGRKVVLRRRNLKSKRPVQ